ncbi:MAG: hypothetical protein GY754_20110 [bacterium]|nr:hypothetical protein [bacterium]
MDVNKFWSIYYREARDCHMEILKRDSTVYNGMYLAAKPWEDMGILKEYEEFSFSISREEFQKYDYTSDKRFNILLPLKEILLNIIEGTISYTSTSVHVSMLQKILKEELGFAPESDTISDFILKNDITIDLFLKRLEKNLEGDRVFKQLDSDQETAFLFFIISHTRDTKSTPVLLSFLEKGESFIVPGDKVYNSVGYLAESLINTNDRRVIPPLLSYLEKTPADSVRIQFGKVLCKLLSFENLVTPKDLGGTYNRDESVQKLKTIYKKHKGLDEIGFLKLDSTSVRWEKRLLSAVRVPRTREGVEILIELLDDEVEPVRVQAKKRIDLYIDLGEYIRTNKKDDPYNERLQQHLREKLPRLSFDERKKRFSIR